MFGLIKSQRIKTTVKVLTDITEGNLDEMLTSCESNSQLLARLGISRQQALQAVISDDEVEACCEDLRAAMLARPWRIYGEGLSDEDRDRLWRVVRRYLPVLAEVVLTAKLSGYGVARYVYLREEDGFLSIDRVSNKGDELDRYTPRYDGTLLYKGDSGDELVDTRVLHLLLTNRATTRNPAGEMAAARLYPAVSLRSRGFVYAAQFIKRYAQPYLVGKILSDGSNERHRSFTDRLFSMLSGGAMSIEREDSVEMLQNSADGQAFRRLENLANARIQKVLLGKVRTADLETGSRAAQETEEKARGDRIDSYLGLLEQAAQHLVDALVMVNAVYGKTINAPKGVWFEFNQQVQVDVKRAERDKQYLDSGRLRLTEDYYKDILGFEPGHFELVDPAPQIGQPAGAKLAVRLSASQLPAPDTVEHTIMRPKVDAILSALAESKDYAAFEERLSGLDLDEADNLLIQRLVADGVRSWSDGADSRMGVADE